MTHGEAAHERGTHNMFTGYRPSPALQFPSFGSVVCEEFGPRQNMPPYVCIPRMPNPYAGSGYLSSAYGPFSLGADPANGGLHGARPGLPSGIDDDRFDRRQSILATVDNHFRSLEKSDALAAMDTFYQRAYSMISSKEAREAFNLAAEPDAIKDAIRPQRGRHAHADGPAARRRRRAVRLDDLRRMGPSHEHQGRLPQPDAAVRQGVCRPDPRPGPAQDARLDDGHGQLRIRPHAQDQRRPKAATTGRSASASCWPAAGSRRA